MSDLFFSEFDILNLAEEMLNYGKDLEDFKKIITFEILEKEYENKQLFNQLMTDENTSKQV